MGNDDNSKRGYMARRLHIIIDCRTPACHRPRRTLSSKVDPCNGCWGGGPNSYKVFPSTRTYANNSKPVSALDLLPACIRKKNDRGQ